MYSWSELSAPFGGKHNSISFNQGYYCELLSFDSIYASVNSFSFLPSFYLFCIFETHFFFSGFGFEKIIRAFVISTGLITMTAHIVLQMKRTTATTTTTSKRYKCLNSFRANSFLLVKRNAEPAVALIVSLSYGDPPAYAN